MKIMMQMSVLAIVEVQETTGFAAKIQMPTPKFAVSPVFIPGPGEGQPNLDTIGDFMLIATAHVLKFLSDGAQEELKEIGEPALTQAGGQA